MAVQIDLTEALGRSSGVVAPTSSYTCSFWARAKTNPAPGNYAPR